MLYFTWIGLNKATVYEAPSEAMRFGGTLYWVIRQVLRTDPMVGPVYLIKA